jgi:hypothetical protein
MRNKKREKEIKKKRKHWNFGAAKLCSYNSPLERSETERKGPRAPEAKFGKRNISKIEEIKRDKNDRKV